MRLLKLNISNFGLFHNKTINLSPGLNLIYGKNEAGKSTVHGFIKGILFGIEKQRGRPSVNDMYSRYQPWDRPGSYDGSLEFEADNNIYHIYRNFDKNNKETSLTHVETGRELKFSQTEFQDLIGGLTEAGYDGTISIEQVKAKTDSELVYLVQNYITNLTMTKSEEIDVKKALELLDRKLKENDIKSLKEEIESLQDKIKEGQSKEKHVDDLTVQMNLIQIEKDRLIKEKEYLINNKFYSQEDLSSLFAEFPVIKTNYVHYLERLEQIVDLQGKIDIIQNKILDCKRIDNQSIKAMKSSLDNINNYKQEYNRLLEDQADHKRQQEDELELDRRRNFKFTSPLLVIALILTLIFFNKDNFIFKVGITLGGIGVILFVFLYLASRKKKKSLQLEEAILEEDLDDIKNHIKKILDKFNIESESELKYRYEEALREEETLSLLQRELQGYKNEYVMMQNKNETLRQKILEYINKFTYIYSEDMQNTELDDAAIGILDEYITDEKLKLNEYEQDIKPKLKNLSMKEKKIRWELELLESNEGELLDNQERYEELIKRKGEYQEEIDSINIAINTIRELSTDIDDTFGKELNKRVSELVKNITNNKYEDIKVDERLNVKTEIGYQYQYLERLSRGTIEQIYFALRLAIADMIYGPGEVPILLDDTFAYYDDNRLKATLNMLSEESNRQILLFTCHNREKELLDELAIDYEYIEM